MIVGIANDHHGIDVKNKIIEFLKNKNVSYVNYGADEINSTDYTHYALKLCEGIKNGDAKLGILICGTGIGMSVIANKIDGIYCAKVSDVRETILAREHNAANVIALGENVQDIEKVVEAFINTEPSNDERHVRRRETIAKVEETN